MLSLWYVLEIILLIGLLVGPALILWLLRRRGVHNMLRGYVIIAGLTGVVLLTGFARAAAYQQALELQVLGVDTDADFYTERHAGVAPEDLEFVLELERQHSGIGWPLKAIFGVLIYLPYLGVIYLAKMFWDLVRKRSRS